MGKLLEEYLRVHKKLHRPKSLHPSLHLAYSIGVARSFYSVGTYADKPLDHGYYPSRAFDLRRKGWVGMWGFGWVTALRLARHYWKHHKELDIDYVIIGRMIISRRNPKWRYYGPDRSHEWHVHVSGWWPGKHADPPVSGGPRPGDH